MVPGPDGHGRLRSPHHEDGDPSNQRLKLVRGVKACQAESGHWIRRPEADPPWVVQGWIPDLSALHSSGQNFHQVGSSSPAIACGIALDLYCPRPIRRTGYTTDIGQWMSFALGVRAEAVVAALAVNDTDPDQEADLDQADDADDAD